MLESARLLPETGKPNTDIKLSKQQAERFTLTVERFENVCDWLKSRSEQRQLLKRQQLDEYPLVSDPPMTY